MAASLVGLAAQVYELPELQRGLAEGFFKIANIVTHRVVKG